MSHYYKKWREEKKKTPDPLGAHSALKLTNTKKTDYCDMYRFLGKIGYDLTRDIHIQFCEKYNLPLKKRPSKSQNHYGPNDCI